jgi:CHASE2 domain-containing sensor protein
VPKPPARDGSAPDHPVPPASQPSPAVRTLARFAALWIIGALLFVFHGISLHLTPWSQAIVNGIVKYGYPTRGQADTTVILFTEENLKNLQESYPVRYERHAEVLEALAAYQPRAVFVDFAFVAP